MLEDISSSPLVAGVLVGGGLILALNLYRKVVTKPTADPAVEFMDENDLNANLTKRDVLVVGGTKGIGYAIVESLALRGSQVVMVGRTRPTNLPKNVEFVQADLSTFKGSMKLVNESLKGRTFDTVVFTSGVITKTALTRTPDGVEEDLAISYMSRFIISNELIKKNALIGRKRLYIMGFPGENDFEPTDINDINIERHEYKTWPVHMNTVIFNEALVHELPRQYRDVHTFGLNPGLIATDIRQNLWAGSKFMRFLGFAVEALLGLFAKTSKDYSERTVIHLIASPELANKSALSFSPVGKVLKPGKWAANEKNCKKIWEESEKLVAKVLGKTQNLN